MNTPDLKSLLETESNNWSSTTSFSFPGEESFTDKTERWTTYAPPTYSAAISPATEEDVAKAVTMATQKDIPFLATGGRHGYGTTLGNLKNGLAIDLSQLNSIRVDKEAETVTIGGGVRWRDILDPVYEAGFEMPIGSGSAPGVVGVTLGGGVGRYSGIYGLVSDSLLSARLVTADGRAIDVSETAEPDLFWALRGAGPNFGIVTSATYKLQRIVEGVNGSGHAVKFDMIFPAPLSEAYFKALEESFGGDDKTMPANLAGITVIIYNEQMGGPALMSNWTYFGPEHQARALLAPLLALNPPVVAIDRVPWNKILATAAFGIDAQLSTNGFIRSIYSANLRTGISASAFQACFDKTSAFYETHPAGRVSAVLLETFPNQAMMARGDDATAYPWRDAQANLLFCFQWDESLEGGEESVVGRAADELGRELRGDFARVSGYDGSGLRTLVNYAHGDETLEEVYGREKLGRLVALKGKWDPRNVFCFNNPLPVE